MSSQPGKTLSPRQLLLVGIIALVAAGAIAANGLISRSRSTQDLVQWTNAQAVPNVTLAKLVRGDAEQTLIMPGSIQPYSKATLYARVSGYLKSWNKDIGAPVKAGDVLASIEAPDLDQQLAQARATLASAKASQEIAAITARRYSALVQTQAVSRQNADQTAADAEAKKAIMDANQANVRQLEAMQSFKQIVAPFDGVVTARNTDIGALINAGSAGQALFEVADLHRVRIYVQVPQAFTADLRPGLKATFEMPQYPSQKFDATLVTTSNAVNEMSRSMQVELQADNPDGKLFGGTYCRVDFQIPGDPNMVRLPATALMPVNRGVQVAVLGDGNKVVLKSIQVGRDFGDTVEVTAGLAPQDRVIDSPPETLRNGDTVQLAAPAPPSTATPSGTPTSSATR
ncbi:MAG: efflux transporter periplasmic adaptor subunit [Rhodospirillales bacterium]|jgi:RND family efflux transporter MFP subunit|nr:efflux transporter periplasmic adaptor subunit [Rhodospirillales bacterium]